MVPSYSLRFAAASTLALLGGCNDYSQTAHIEKVVPVSGTVTFQGRPLEGYRVVFMPTDGRRPASGVTDSAGKFTLGTNTADDGAPPGASKVSFAWSPPTLGEPGQEIIADTPDKMPKPKVKIPDRYTNPETSGITHDVPARGQNDVKFELQ
jgi:hypothetical protein